MLFQTPSLIQKIQTLVDGGVKLSVITQELSAEEMAKLFELKGKAGWFLFKENPIKEEEVVDLPEIKPEFVGEKTPSQRLRAVIFVHWENTRPTKTFEEFYRKEMERIINRYKELYLE